MKEDRNLRPAQQRSPKAAAFRAIGLRILAFTAYPVITMTPAAFSMEQKEERGPPFLAPNINGRHPPFLFFPPKAFLLLLFDRGEPGTVKALL